MVQDDKTGKLHNTKHADFDEAHYSVPASKRPPMGQVMIDARYTLREIDIIKSAHSKLFIKPTHSKL